MLSDWTGRLSKIPFEVSLLNSYVFLPLHSIGESSIHIRQCLTIPCYWPPVPQVWCGTLERAKFAKKLERIQRASLLDFCSALQTTPIITLNVILHITPVDIADRCIVAKVALRLRETEYMKGSKQDHAEILSSFNCIPENLDHCITKATPGGCFFAHIPPREMWTGLLRYL